MSLPMFVKRDVT